MASDRGGESPHETGRSGIAGFHLGLSDGRCAHAGPASRHRAAADRRLRGRVRRAFAEDLGADFAIDSAVEGFRERIRALCAGKGPDVVFDPVCGPLFEPAFRSLAWRGRHLVIGFAGGPIPSLAANLPLLKGAALVGVDVRQFLLYEAGLGEACLGELLGWVVDGSLLAPVGREFAFEDFVPALEYALCGQGRGKTILRIADEQGASR